MGLKERVMECLAARDHDALGRLLASQPRAIRHVYGRLWDPDAGVRSTASEALGVATQGRPELGREVLRRVVWGLQDEAATNGGPAIPVLGAVAARAPDIAAPFVGPIASLLSDERLRPDLQRVLERVACTAPQLIEPLGAYLGQLVDRYDPSLRPWLEDLLDRVRGGTHGA